MKFYENVILEGRWKYKSESPTTMVEFENIYNGNTIRLSHRQIRQVMNGKDTVGHIMSRRMGHNKHTNWGNNVLKRWGQLKHINYIKWREEK